MFIGSIPKKLITQILGNIHLKPRIFIGCSGSFRTEHAIKNLMPDRAVYGNDVSLLSCAVGNLLTGQKLDVEFSGRYSLEHATLDGCAYAGRVELAGACLRGM